MRHIASQLVQVPKKIEIYEVQDSVTKLLHPYAKLFEKEFVTARQKDDDLTVISNVDEEVIYIHKFKKFY